MKTNQRLQKDVQDAIDWEPFLQKATIGVFANNGIVTLTGIVDSYLKKSQAEDAAKKVVGVKAVVEKIEVKYNDAIDKSDSDIAADVLNSIEANWELPADKIKVKVENGRVTLIGEVQWNFEKEAATKAVRNLDGIRVLINDIDVVPESRDDIEQKKIEDALKRNWSTTDQDIKVNVANNSVILKGTVSSHYQKDEAERIAWNAPGVWNVDNILVIDLKD